MVCSAEIFRASGVKSTFTFRTELRNSSISANRKIFGASVAAGKIGIREGFLEKIPLGPRGMRAYEKTAWNFHRPSAAHLRAGTIGSSSHKKRTTRQSSVTVPAEFRY
jgi:hypothetical protein